MAFSVPVCVIELCRDLRHRYLRVLIYYCLLLATRQHWSPFVDCRLFRRNTATSDPIVKRFSTTRLSAGSEVETNYDELPLSLWRPHYDSVVLPRNITKMFFTTCCSDWEIKIQNCPKYTIAVLTLQTASIMF